MGEGKGRRQPTMWGDNVLGGWGEWGNGAGGAEEKILLVLSGGSLGVIRCVSNYEYDNGLKKSESKFRYMVKEKYDRKREE